MQVGIKKICNRQLDYTVLVKFTEAVERAEELAGPPDAENA
jgi:hypothetical protein